VLCVEFVCFLKAAIHSTTPSKSTNSGVKYFVFSIPKVAKYEFFLQTVQNYIPGLESLHLKGSEKLNAGSECVKIGNYAFL
jgi:hypothetical protein